MKFWEALKAIEEGKKIRRKDFGDMNPHGFGKLIQLLANCCEDEMRSWLSADWEVVEPTVSFQEAVSGLYDAKCYRRQHWAANIYMTILCGRPHIVNSNHPQPNCEDILGNDWMEIKE